jgi:hypothetical protein
MSEEFSVEDLTVMKLMEEIMEFEQEIKMKQKWIKTRMQMLNKILPTKQRSKATAMVEDFIEQMSIHESERRSVTYESQAIPMKQGDVLPEAVPMKQGDVYDTPIQM